MNVLAKASSKLMFCSGQSVWSRQPQSVVSREPFSAEAEEYPLFEANTKQRLVKAQQTGKTWSLL
jgi:hypothetical protein